MALLRHLLLDDAHDRHHDRATDATAGDLADERSDIKSATRRGAAERRDCHAEQLSAYPAADDAGDRIAKCPETGFLHQATGDVAADRTADELDNQWQPIHDSSCKSDC